VEILLALTSALLFALGTVLQQRAGLESASDGGQSSVLLRLVGHPVWVAGIAADGLGFVAQAGALSIGRLAVVQPVLVASVVFAIPLGVKLSDQTARRADAVFAAVVVAALAVFLLVAKPLGGRSEAPIHGWVIAGAICLAVCVPLVARSRNAAPSRRAALLGTGAGILFALCAALTKAVVGELHLGVVHVLSSWELYALVGVGYVSMTLNQLALDTGALAATMAASTTLDPIASVVLGLTLLHEAVHTTALQTIVMIVALAVALLGVLALARSHAHPAQNNGNRKGAT
jgi:drug/metabolite transporter (DMT)-like permease